MEGLFLLLNIWDLVVFWCNIFWQLLVNWAQTGLDWLQVGKGGGLAEVESTLLATLPCKSAGCWCLEEGLSHQSSTTWDSQGLYIKKVTEWRNERFSMGYWHSWSPVNPFLSSSVIKHISHVFPVAFYDVLLVTVCVSLLAWRPLGMAPSLEEVCLFISK